MIRRKQKKVWNERRGKVEKKNTTLRKRGKKEEEN